MSKKWQLQEAKNKLSEVVEAALSDGPQIITRHGVETAIILSYAEYRALKLKKKKLTEFFRESPLFDLDIDLTRDKSGLRPNISL